MNFPDYLIGLPLIRNLYVQDIDDQQGLLPVHRYARYR